MGCFGGGSTKVQQVSNLTGLQAPVLNDMLRFVQPEIGRAGPSFPGERVPGFSPLQQSGLDLAGQIPGAIGAAQGEGFSALQDILGQTPEDFFGPAQESAQRLFDNVISPNVLGRFAQTGSANSGGAQRALSEAGRDLSLGLADRLSGLGLQQQAQQISALPQLINLANLTSQGAGQLFNLGTTQRSLAVDRAAEQEARFREGQALYNPAMTIASQLVGFPTGESLGLQRAPGLGRSVIGGLAGSEGAGSTFLSGLSGAAVKAAAGYGTGGPIGAIAGGLSGLFKGFSD